MSLTNWRDLWDERWRGLFPHFCHYSPEKNNRLKRVRDLNVWDDPTFAEPRFLIVPIIMWSTFTLMKRHCRSPVLGQRNYCFLTHNLDDPLLYVSLFYVIKMNSLSLSLFSKNERKGQKLAKNKAKETKMAWVDLKKPNFPLSKFWKTLTSLRVIYCPCVTISLFFVEVEVVQIHYLILQVQSDQHEPELLGSPCSFYRSCSSPLIPDQHSKGICSCHCPSFVHLSIYVLYPLSEKT